MAARPYLDLPGPWVVAHRGGAALAPENTFLAFDRAVELGADAIEIDVRMTSDGVVVVFHDEDTARLTGEPGTIEGRASDEVAALDAGFAFTPDGGRSFPHRGRGVTVPRLSETLARYPRMRFNLDAKSEDPPLVEALARTILEAGAVERVCVGSFHDLQAERLGRLLPGACRYLPQDAGTCHVLAAKADRSGSGCPAGFDLADLPHRIGILTVVDAKVVRYFHRRGMPVHVWTVDDEPTMRALLALGVDGIVTDRPDVLARVLGR